MRVALVHDYLREYGGAERVVEVLHELYPEAPLYTAFVDWESLGEFAEKFKSWDIRTTWVDGNWLVKKWHSPLRFLTPLVWESLKLQEFDVIISSSGWYMCRGVITHPGQVHISYIHHPPRNLYGFATGSAIQSPLARMYAALINPFLRVYDYTTAQRVDYLIANSETTKQRIKKFYRRDAEVIYPPATQAKLAKALRAGPPIVMSNIKNQISNVKGDPSTSLRTKNSGYFLSVGRLTYAKRIDVVIEACNQLNLPLKIVGTGREEEKLKALAARPPSTEVEGAVGRGSTIEFVGAVSDEELQNLYRGAKALIFCALEEDFGMVPVEAMSHGVPVIALNQGGVRETVQEGKTGVFFDEPNVNDLIKAIKKFETTKFNIETILNNVQKFSKEVFKKKMREYVEDKYRLQQSA